MARSARPGLSAGISTRVTSGLALRTRRVTGSEAATGKLAQVWTVRATFVPSTSTCSTARCSLSAATMTTASSGITTCSSLKFDEGLSNAAALQHTSLVVLVELPSVHKRFRIRGRGRRLRVGRNAMHRAQDHECRITLLQALAAKKVSQDRNIAQTWNLVIDVGYTIVYESRNHKALPILQFKFSFSFAGAQGGHRKSGD